MDEDENALAVQKSGARRFGGLSQIGRLTIQGKISLVTLAVLIPASTAVVVSKHGLRLPQLPGPDLLASGVVSWGRRCGWGVDAAVQLVNAFTGVAFLWALICIMARLKDSNRKGIGRQLLMLLLVPLLILFMGRYLVSLM